MKPCTRAAAIISNRAIVMCLSEERHLNFQAAKTMDKPMIRFTGKAKSAVLIVILQH